MLDCVDALKQSRRWLSSQSDHPTRQQAKQQGLWSLVRYVQQDYLSGMSSINLEAQLLLKLHSEFLDLRLGTVARVCQEQLSSDPSVVAIIGFSYCY